MRLWILSDWVIDDRGRRCRMRYAPTTDEYNETLVTEANDEEEAARLRHEAELSMAWAARRELASLNRSRRPLIFGLSMAGALIAAIVLFIAGWQLIHAGLAPRGPIQQLLGGIGCLVLGLVAIAGCVIAPRFIRWRDSVLAERLAILPEVCLACCTDLSEETPDDNHLLVCPGCGGAWKTIHASIGLSNADRSASECA